MKMVLFICTGNTCRSPMGEGILRALLLQRGIEDVTCESAGLYAAAGTPPSREAIRAARHYGADISRHIARPVTEALVRNADVLICMTPEHARELTAKYHAPPEKIVVLDVKDPYGSDETVYDDAAYDIREALVRLLNQNRI